MGVTQNQVKLTSFWCFSWNCNQDKKNQFGYERQGINITFSYIYWPLIF